MAITISNMSNYLFISGKTDLVEKLMNYFIKEYIGAKEEISFSKINKYFSVLIIERRSEEILSSIIQKAGNGLFFRGQALDHKNSSMILGINGFSKFQENNPLYYNPSLNLNFEGSYVVARWNKNKLTFENDLFSLFRLLYFSNKDIFISSDSLVLINECLKILKIPRKINQIVAQAKAWSVSGLPNAPLNKETIIENIYTMTAGKSIEISLNKDSLVLNCKEKPIKELFTKSKQDYVTTLRECGKRMYTSINFVVKSFKPLIEFGLSGGIDSRVLLSLCMKSEEIMDSLIITTSKSPARIKDYQVVEHLARKYNFIFNNNEYRSNLIKSHNVKRTKIENTFGFWILNALGTYDAFYLDKFYWENPSIMSMLGVGAEPVKQTKDKDKIQWKAKYQHPLIRESVISLMSNAAISSGIDPTSTEAMKWHHMTHKAAHHVGRKIAVSCMLIRPYVQKSVFAISRLEDNPYRGKEPEGPSVLHDLLIILNPKLASEDFDEESKNITQDYIDRKLKELGGLLDLESIEEPSIYGKVEHISNGPANLFLNIVKDFSWRNDDSYKLQLLEMVNEIYNSDMIEKDLKILYADCYNNTVSKLSDNTTELSTAGALASRFLIFNLFK